MRSGQTPPLQHTPHAPDQHARAVLPLVRVHEHRVVAAVEQDVQRRGDGVGVLVQERLLDGGLEEVVERDIVGSAPGCVFREVRGIAEVTVFCFLFC